MKIAFIIIVIHWIADFLCQTDWQAKNKSTNFKALLLHTLTYSFIFWWFAMLIFKDAQLSFYFWSITLMCHTLIDFFTSKLNTYLWSKGKVHYFFVSIGFDQILHYSQLFLTYYLLI